MCDIDLVQVSDMRVLCKNQNQWASYTNLIKELFNISWGHISLLHFVKLLNELMHILGNYQISILVTIMTGFSAVMFSVGEYWHDDSL